MFIPDQLCQKDLITNMCCVISILTISNLSLLIAPVLVPPFIYNPTGHVINGDLKIINNTREVFDKGPKYREPKSIIWKHNFKILIDSVEDYARQLAKPEKEDCDTLSEWVKSVRSLMQIRI